jgi:chromosome segregation ATPase
MERSLMLAKKYQHLTLSEGSETFSETSEASDNLARLPTAKVKSGAIESLISQNEDLSARLKVLLRRLASIEEENLKLTQEHREMKHQLTGLSDQIAINREKESNWRERTITAEEALEIQQSQLRQKEIEFAKLRTQEWEMREHLQTQLDKIERSYHRLLRYRARIKNWVNPSMKGLQQLLQEKEFRIEQFRRELQNTEIQCQTLIHKNLEQVKKSREALRSVEEEKIHLIAQFEQQREDLQSEMTTLRETTGELRKRAALLDRSLERQDYLENRLVFAERENQELRTKFNEEFTLIQNQMYEWRSKATSLEVERDSLFVQKNDLEIQYKRTKELADRLDEQMEALRLLWKEKVHENEKLKNNQQALEAINSELSIKLNELRNQKLTEE